VYCTLFQQVFDRSFVLYVRRGIEGSRVAIGKENGEPIGEERRDHTLSEKRDRTVDTVGYRAADLVPVCYGGGLRFAGGGSSRLRRTLPRHSSRLVGDRSCLEPDDQLEVTHAFF